MINALLTFGRVAEGKPGAVDLTVELDGINNNYGFLSLLLGLPTLAERSGILNHDFLETERVLTEKDVRHLVAGSARSVINTLASADDPGKANLRDQLSIFVDTIDALSVQKDAWKKVVMVFSYGMLDPGGLGVQQTEAINEIPGFAEELSRRAGDYKPEDILTVATGSSTKFIQSVMADALGDVKDYAVVTKSVGKLAALLGEELTLTAPSGLEINLSGFDYEFQGHETSLGMRGGSLVLGQDVEGTAKEQARVSAPGLVKDEGQNVPLNLDKAAEQPVESFYAKKYLQGNRAPVLLVHMLDAAVMVKVANVVAGLNKKRPANKQIWFHQIFDAVNTDPASMSLIQDIYNKEMLKMVRDFNPFKEYQASLSKVINKAISTGDPKVANYFLRFGIDKGTIDSKLSNEATSEINRVQAKLEEAHRQLDNGLRLLENQRTYSNSLTIDKKSKELKKKYDDMFNSSSHKMNPTLMRKILENSWIVSKIRSDLSKNSRVVDASKVKLNETLRRQQVNIDAEYGAKFGDGLVMGNLY